MSSHLRGAALLIGVIVLSLFVAGTAAAAGPASPTDSAGNHSVEVTVRHVDTGTVYAFDSMAEFSNAELPAGEYQLSVIRTIDGEVVREQRRITVGPASHDVEEAVHLDVVAGSTVDIAGGSSDSINIWVGAVNESKDGRSGVGSVPVTLTVRAPDGTTETFDLTTDSTGSAHVSYQIDGGSGWYDLEVNSSMAEFDGFGSFQAGELVEVYPGINEKVEVGRTSTLTVAVTDGGEPVPNRETSLEIRAPDGSTDTRSVTTDANGLATFEFTPSQTGSYSVWAGDQFAGGFQAGQVLSSVRVNGDRFGDDVYSGQTIHVTGQLRDAGSAYANQPIIVEIVNTTDFDTRGTETNLSTSTNDYGQFAVEWTPPTTSNARLDYRVNLYTADGQPIPTGFVDIEVAPYPEQAPGETPPLTVDAEWSDAFFPTIKPGATETLVLTVTDENGNAVGDATVDVEARYGFRAVPGFATTVTTNATGQATVDVSLPSDAPDGEFLEVRAYATAGGDNASTSASAELQRAVVDDDIDPWGEGVSPGGSIGYEIAYRDADTGDPISGASFLAVGETNGFLATSFDGGGGTTNATGVATTTIDVPTDAADSIHIADIGPYVSPHSFPYIPIRSYGVTIQGLDDHEVQPGETITFDYAVDTDASTSAVIVVKTWDNYQTNHTVLLSTIASPGSSQSVTIPSSVPEFTDYQIIVRTTTDAGATSVGEEFFRVRGESVDNSPPTADFTYSPSSPTADDTITFDGSSSSDSDGTIESYEWDFDGDGTVDATGEQVERSLDAGEHDVTLTVTDDAGATDSVTRTITVDEAPTGKTVALQPSETSAGVNETATFEVVIADVTNGVGAFNFTVSVANTSVAEIVDASAGANVASQQVTIADDNGSVQVSGFGGDTADTGNVSIGTVTVRTVADGETAVGLEVAAISDEDANAYEVSATPGATLQASSTPGPPPVVGDATPTDPDGDGKYEDVNGDGSVNVIDVQALFANLNSDAVQNNQAAFDYNDDGSANVIDVQALFVEVAS